MLAAVSVNVSPAVTDFEALSAPVNRQLPAVEASHSEMCEYVSVVETFVQVMSAEAVITPLDGAPKLAALRVASVAALVVPSSPGEPVCSLT